MQVEVNTNNTWIRDMNGRMWSSVRERFQEEGFLSQIWKDDLLGGRGRKQKDPRIGMEALLSRVGYSLWQFKFNFQES